MPGPVLRSPTDWSRILAHQRRHFYARQSDCRFFLVGTRCGAKREARVASSRSGPDGDSESSRCPGAIRAPERQGAPVRRNPFHRRALSPGPPPARSTLWPHRSSERGPTLERDAGAILAEPSALRSKAAHPSMKIQGGGRWLIDARAAKILM